MQHHRIPMHLRAAYLSMHRQSNLHLAPLAITADQFVCLLILSEADGIIQTELVRRASSDPNTIRAMLVLLERRGYVDRRPHPDDRRARQVFITRTGRGILQAGVDALAPVRDRIAAALSEGEAATINTLLGRIAAALTR